MNALPHPIQYQGSKRQLATRILEYFPDDIETLYEPFAGSAAISIAAASRGLAKRFAINDLNEPLARLLQCIVEKPDAISLNYGALWTTQGEKTEQSVEHFNRIRELFNQTQQPELLLYLLARCVKGAVRYNREGLFNQSPDKRRRGTKPENMRRNIFGVSSLLKGKAIFTSLDYRQAIEGASSEDLVYMDPPYQGVSGERDGRYLSGLIFDSFVDSLEILNDRGISYIVSYDGKLGERSYGEMLPSHLELERLELVAGRSSTATLLGRTDVTVESLYLSKHLIRRLPASSRSERTHGPGSSLPLFNLPHDTRTIEAVY